MATKASTPKGFRDFHASDVQRRRYLAGVIQNRFEQFGFGPIETPTLENYGTLMGKYGDEGDRLVFKTLNSGDFLKKARPEVLEAKDSQALLPSISDKAMRYDLTVPFARYTVQHQNDLAFPFKRYQMQLVWRADKPQRGRFREFMQCDADVIGSGSLLQEIELVQLYAQVFQDLGLHGCTIKINHRKVLQGLADYLGASDQIVPFTVALDKLDKIGREKVLAELEGRGFANESLERASSIIELAQNGKVTLQSLSVLIGESETGQQGIQDLQFVMDGVEELGLHQSQIELDITLARGLNYYTGCIFEVAAPDSVQMGSIGGGGRYDDLTGSFGLKNMSGVGVSFGFARIYLVLEELNLFPETATTGTQVLFLNTDHQDDLDVMKTVTRFRESGIRTEYYPDAAKLKKQYNYAEKKGIVHVASLNASDPKIIKLKSLTTGEELEGSIDTIIAAL